MGWLIDPEDKAVFVYQPSQEPEIFDEPGAALPMPPFMRELEDLFALLLL